MECAESGELGFCKTTHVAQEKICSDLARLVDVKVPPVRLGNIEGHDAVVAVSLAHGKESIDLRMLQERSPAVYSSTAVRDAIHKASGLLAFHTWVGNTDLKDDHLVIAEDQGEYTVAAIDFAYSMQWGAPDEAVVAASGPSALVSHLDKDVIRATVERIEQVTDEQIDHVVAGIPDQALSAAERVRISQGLKVRREQVRAAMQAKGWMP